MQVKIVIDTQDRIYNEWVLEGTILLNAVITDAGYSGTHMGTVYEVYADDAAVIL